MSPFPGLSATLQALFMGLFIPVLSSIIPIQKVLQKTICDSMSKRTKSGSVVEVTENGKADYVPFLGFGIISVVYGISIFVFLPMALLNGDLGVMLTIFFFILVGMIYGLSMLATNI